MPIFNEKAVLRLGRGLQDDRPAERGRHGAGADRDAPLPRGRPRDGRRSRSRCWRPPPCATRRTAPLSSQALRERMPGVPIHILSGSRGSRLLRRRHAVRHSQRRTACWPTSAAARWRSCGWSTARVVRRRRCRLGVIRLAERSGGDPVRAQGDRRGRFADGPVAWARRPAAICIWSAAHGGRWRASTSRRPAIRCRWCTITRSAGRKPATWPA